MPASPSRRDLLTAAAAAALAVAAGPPEARAQQPGPTQAGPMAFGPGNAFSWSGLVQRARERAAKPYQPPSRPAPEILDRIDYEQHGKIRFKPDNALFADGPSVYPITFFPLGRLFRNSVRMFALDGDRAREIFYAPALFDMPPDSPARDLPASAGFAGFQIKESKTRPDWRTQDWVAFLGASYFRAIGALGQYGLSARGVAIDVAAPKPEEFPDFVEFYFQGAANASTPVVVHALLDGPSLAGAFRFSMRRTENVVMDVECQLFTRQAIFRLGIAPLTSMFWYAEYGKPGPVDWRPEIHDSDGLELWTGAGERIWRPLVNPPRIITSAFMDTNPRGFGLMQRDRNNENYLDGVNYERRPSLWVEPIGAWGDGSIQLVEIPTDDEIHDNIVAMWVPRLKIEGGQEHEFRYRLHWVADEPYPAEAMARVVATRMGRGGEPGKPRPPGVTKFVVEFAGRPLSELHDLRPEPVVTTSRGTISLLFAEPVPWTDRWRAQFDVAAEGADPVDIRLFLKAGDRAVSETWLYQHHPRPVG
ncbi:glucan biosynthesis protein [Prosthecomicrobium sp. N25]|uniref:glucan biosynthesis protein n=1 Tax=Prosthecomicrobium sp. N25 TaxID=3129254 RepID=UPI003078A18B